MAGLSEAFLLGDGMGARKRFFPRAATEAAAFFLFIPLPTGYEARESRKT